LRAKVFCGTPRHSDFRVVSALKENRSQDPLVRMRKAFRRVIRDVVVEALAFLPVRVKRLIMSKFRRPVLWVLFHLETEPITIARAGLPLHRFRMWLDWQGNQDYVLGLYEPEAMYSVRQSLRLGSCCVDVGANIGYYTISMARWVGPRGLVVAFEPFPKNFEVLEKNVRLNGLHNVRLEPLAVAFRNDWIPLTYGSEEPLSTTPSVNAYAVCGNREQIRVPARSLDHYMAELGCVPDLIKIDVEGGELAVLRGAREILESVRPILLLEVHDWGSPEARKIIDFLSECGYRTDLLMRRGREAVFLCANRRDSLRSLAEGGSHRRCPLAQ
jgi:FkbM family methyltransferase